MPVSFADAKKATDQFLEVYFDEQTKAAKTIDSNYEQLWRNIRQVALAGGKRLRPYLVFVGFGKIDEQILPVAAAQELLHVALLMHDDIIDRDNIRHGVKNLNGLYEDIYKSVQDDSQRAHFAHSAAILAGDLLISDAHRLIAESNFDSDQKLAASSCLARSIFEVAGGELLDVEASFMSGDYDPLVVYRYKTAGYSFVGPLITGALLANSSDQDIENLRQYAINLGIAYQLQDDYLGAFGDEDETGKSTSCDLYEGKKTYLLGKFLEHAGPAEKDLHQSVVGGDKSQESLQKLKQAIVDSGAVKANSNLEQEFADKAVSFIEKISDLDQKKTLLALAEKLTSRKS